MQLYYWNPTSAWVFSCKFAACFQNTFSRSVIEIPPRSAGTPLEGCFWTWWIYENCKRNWLKIKKMVPFLQEPNFCSFKCSLIFWSSSNEFLINCFLIKPHVLHKRFLRRSLFLNSKVVAQRYSVKKLFLKFSQNSQENACARVSFLIKLQATAIINYLNYPFLYFLSCLK